MQQKVISAQTALISSQTALQSVQTDLISSKNANSKLKSSELLAQQQLQSLRVNIVRLFSVLNLPDCPVIEKASEVDAVVEELCKTLDN